MKKILLFGFTDKKGGIESFLLDFIKHVNRNSFSFDCIVNTSVVAYEKELLELGVGVYHLPMRSKAPLKFKKECHNFFKKKLLNMMQYGLMYAVLLILTILSMQKSMVSQNG